MHTLFYYQGKWIRIHEATSVNPLNSNTMVSNNMDVCDIASHHAYNICIEKVKEIHGAESLGTYQKEQCEKAALDLLKRCVKAVNASGLACVDDHS
jgi:hypothetical protein